MAVNGSVNCNGKSATISLPRTEVGTSYVAYIGNTPVSDMKDGKTGSLTINLYPDFLAIGKNVIKVKVRNLGCPDYFLNDTALVDIQLPTLAKPSIQAAGPTVFCAGGQVQLSGPTGMAGYQWSNGQSTEKIMVSSSGFYRLRVKDAAGCYSPYSEVIEVQATPTNIDLGLNETICVNALPRLITGYAPLGGTWSGKGVSSAGMFNPAMAGVGEHRLTYTFCNKSAVKTIQVTPLPKITDFTIQANQDILCYGSYTRVVLYNVVPRAKYEIYQGNQLIDTIYPENTYTDFFTNPIKENTYIRVKGTALNECGSDTLSKKYFFNLFVNPHIKVQTNTPVICKKEAPVIYVVKSEPEVLYQLQNGFLDIGAPQMGNGDTLKFQTGPLSKATTFSVAAKKSYCTTTLLQTVTVKVSGPSAYFTVNTYNPEVGEAVTILNSSLNENGKYEWNFGPGASILNSTEKNPATITYPTPGTYNITLTCTGPDGCVDVTIRTVTVINPVTPAPQSYSLSSVYGEMAAIGSTYDSEENSYTFLKSEFAQYGTYHYSPAGDDLVVKKQSANHRDNWQTLVKYNSKGLVQWATYLSHASNWVKGGDVKTDVEGNVYVSYFHGEHLDSIQAFSTDGSSVIFDPPHDGHNNTAVVILKYNKNGILQWHATYLDTYTTSKTTLALDNNLNVYCGSETKLCKLDKNGKILWTKAQGYSDLKIDSQSKIWGLRVDALVLDKYDASGNVLFRSNPPVKIGEAALHITPLYLNLDKQDNLYVSGIFAGEFALDKYSLSNNYNPADGHKDIFLGKLNKSGSLSWLKQVGTSEEEPLKGMDVKNDKIILFGKTAGNNISYNRLPDKTYRDNLNFAAGGSFVGLTDTSATENMRLVKINDGVDSYLNYHNNLISFSKKQDNVLFALPLKRGLILNQEINIKPIFSFQSNIISFRSDLALLFRPVPPVSYFTSANSICVGGTIQFSDASSENPSSWNWSIPGAVPAASSERNPQIKFEKPGTYTVSLTSTNAIGTGNTYSKKIMVEDFPVIRISPGIVCEGTDLTLTASGASTYNWGNGKTGASFSLTNVKRDTTITVTGRNAAGCETKVNHTINVIPTPEVRILTGLGPICQDAAPINLPAASPAGGNYSGPGVTRGIFNPALAKIGKNTIIYTYTNSNGCTGIATLDVMVKSRPNVSFASLIPVCLGQSVINLTGGFPEGGTYSGNGVSNGIFNPHEAGVGTHLITYSYTLNGCTTTATRDIIVTPEPQAPQVPTKWFYCLDSHVDTLLAGTQDYIRWYSVPEGGSALDISLLTKSNKVGTTDYYISTMVNGCESKRTKIAVTITSPPEVNAGSDQSICIGAGTIQLSGFSPAGGTWLGKGVSSTGIFSPLEAGIGNHTLIYSFTQNGCSVSGSKIVTVMESPVTTLSPFNQTICSSNNAFILTGGKPTRGEYSGPGVIDGVFNATIAGTGKHSIVYTYTANGCTTSAVQVITVSTCTGVKESESAKSLLLYPNPTKDKIHVAMNFATGTALQLKLVDAKGVTLLEQNFNLVSGKFNQILNLKDKSKGVYLLQLLTDKEIINKRIILE
ncbi:PKD domain-containing protein [Adhaeribacter pallidiroseus]|uniref:PKD domain-containing protein n=1 Tax=Adhaeribacter pallidiroseus TaxID=2072847 RepID=UPI001F46F5CA|nr:PKD domain-containing protein [Adhaeribacter pallidiroseus]